MKCVRSHNQSSKKKKKGVKVVYISTPMKVKTSASQFRALVQQLTGRHSDTARIMAEQTSSDDSVATDQRWGEGFEGEMFPFSSLFGNDDRSAFNYYYGDDDRLDLGIAFDDLL